LQQRCKHDAGDYQRSARAILDKRFRRF